MHEPLITIVGNVARPPKLRTVASGHFVTDFRVASTPRRLDKATQTWSDGETLWFAVSAWRALAEHCAASLRTGDRVIVTGRLASRTWQGEDGGDHTALEVDATTIGLDLSRGNATYDKGAVGVTEDQWSSSGEVDPDTGEVYPAGLGAAEGSVVSPAA